MGPIHGTIHKWGGTVENHFREICDLKLPIQAIYADTVEISNCTLVYKNPDEKELMLIARRSRFAEGEKVSLSYGIGNKAYAFETTITRVENHDDRSTALYLRFPKAIDECERRKHIRVATPRDKPIKIKLALPNGEFIYVDAIDISVSGVAFAVPKAIRFYEKGAGCIMNVTIPDMGDICVSGTVLNLRTVLDVNRLGVEFTALSEKERHMLVRYISMRELEARDEKSVIPKRDVTKIVVISDDPKSTRKFAFLHPHFSVTQAKTFNALPDLVDNMPSLILLDCDLGATEILLHALKKHIYLRHIPVVVSDRASGKTHEKGDYIVEMEGAVNPQSYVKMIELLTARSRFVKNIKRRWEGHVGTHRTIAVIDRFGYLGQKYLDYFKTLNFEVSVIDDEHAIFQTLQRIMPDIIIIDEDGDKLGAASVCRLINTDTSINTIPVVLMMKDKAAAKQHVSAGLATGFIIKPFSKRQLFLEVVDALMKKIAGAARSART